MKMLKFALILLLVTGCAANPGQWREDIGLSPAQQQRVYIPPIPQNTYNYMLPTRRQSRVADQQSNQYQPAQQGGARANWTGSSTIVQTITNQSGFECQYQYNGQYITRVFVGSSCPSSIQIQ